MAQASLSINIWTVLPIIVVCSHLTLWFQLQSYLHIGRLKLDFFLSHLTSVLCDLIGFQISGEATVVKKALYEIATRLHKNPSRSQHLLASAAPNIYSSSSLVGHTAGAPIVGMASLMGSYRGYKGESGDLSRSFYSAPRNESSSKEFSICLLCPTANIGGVIGKGGVIINQIRQNLVQQSK